MNSFFLNCNICNILDPQDARPLRTNMYMYIKMTIDDIFHFHYWFLNLFFPCHNPS